MAFERRSSRYAVLLASILFLFGFLCGNCNLCLAYQASELSEEETQQVQATERFLKVLEKSPRRGTALDRVYGHHVEFGTLDKFIKQLNERVAKNAKDSEAWMLLGLFESQRGNDATAVDAYQQATALRPEDPLATYYLGQSQLRIGQTVEAVAAFEQALTRKPARADLLEIFQQLGRVHQRAQRTDEALKVWQRLESLFPDDPRVLEQIAVTLTEEGGHALALARYQRLAELVKDDYRRVLFQVEAAGLKIKTNRRDEGIADMEAVLTDLNPSSWLYRDIRRRIEDIFLKSGDQDNLVKYYQKWLGAHPEDIESMSRLAKFLASSARVPEAKEWMEKALKLAPSRSDLRKAFIDQLIDDQRIPEAIQQYEQLAVSSQGNPDVLRDWGKLVLKDKSQEMEARKKEASRIWNQIVAIRPDDASNLAQVADFFRQSNLNEEATALYQKAIEKAPNDPQYREYLGEFLHVQKRTDEAMVIWNSIAEGARRNAVNVTRLAEVYNSFGFHEQSIVEIAEACRMDTKDFSLQIKSAEYHMRADKFDESLGFVAAAEKLAVNDDEREMVVKQRIEVLQSSQRLEAEVEKLAAAVHGNASATIEQWHLLARYQEAERQWSPSSNAIEEALKIDPKSIPVLTTAARIAEASGDFGKAADFNRKLAATDRRSLGDHLMNVARLEAQLGRSDEAIKAAQDLIISAPGKTDNYEFLAQLCFRLGKQAEGLEALRKAVRINPNEPHLIMTLGAALADQLRVDEAIELYWRAFDKSEDLDDKISLTLKLAPLYQQINQFDKLIERFERDRREEEKRREMTICLAQAHNTAGDYGTARQEMESLLSQDTRDTNLLQQLAKLCESGSDLEAAIGYQRQLVAIAPGAETEFPLAKMLQSRGDHDEATEILVRLTRREEDPVRLLKSLDSLLTNSSLEAVISITEPLLSQQRDDWELMYREGVAWSLLNKPEEAKNRFQRLLDQAIPHDTLSASAEAKQKQALSKARSDNLRGVRSQLPKKQSPLEMQYMASQVQRAVGLFSERSYSSSSSGPPPVWTPEVYGVARMAAYGWLLKFEEDAANISVSKRTDAKATGEPAGDSDKQASRSIVDEIVTKAASPTASREMIYDWLYVAALKNKNEDVFNIARGLAKAGGKEEQQFFLTSLQLRGVDSNQNRSSNSGEVAPKKTPLSEDDLELMMKCYEALGKDKSTEMSAAVSNGQILYSGGQVYVNIGGAYQQVSGVSSGNGMYLSSITNELQLAGREKQAQELLDKYAAEAKSTSELSGAMSLFGEKDKSEDVRDLYSRWVAQAKQEIAKASTVLPTSQSRSAVSTGSQILGRTSSVLTHWMGKLGPDEAHAEILSILDPALDLAIIEAKQRRAARSSQTRRKSTSSRRPSSGQYYLELTYGKENIGASIDFPKPNDYVDQTTLALLREVFEVFKRNDVLSDLPNHLRQRLAKSSEDDRLYEQLILATALWWTDEQDEAVELMTKAADSLKEDVDFRFEMASMQELRGDFEEALEIVDSIVPRDQQLLQRKELMALQLAERLGDNDRAYAATEKLFGLRLDTDTQLDLAKRMRRLGLHEMADAVISRVERKSGSQTSSLASLMMMYQGQGKATEAKQLAHMLLQRTKSPISAMSNSVRNPFRYRTPPDATRTQALQLLQQTGELKLLVEQTEKQLARSPESLRLYEHLIEFSTTLGDRAKIGELLEKAVAQKPDSAAFRYQLAKQLESTGKVKEACDQYLELTRLKPEWVVDDLSSMTNLFKRAKRVMELAEAIRGVNVKKLQQPYYVVDLVTSLMEDEKGVELATELFEKVFDAFPNYRSTMISRIRDPKQWNNERIYQLGKRSVIPTATEVSSKPWFGVDQIYSRSSDGSVTGMFGQLLQGVGTTERGSDLQKSIAENVKEYPTWLGGKAMIALIDLKANRRVEGMKGVEALIESDEALKAIPSDTCWLIGQELDKFQEGQPAALKLFEQALATKNSSSSQQLQFSPIVRMVKLYADAGRKDEIRELLLNQLKTNTFSQYDTQYSSYQKIENTTWVADKFLELGFSVDSVKLYREILDDPQKLQQAASWNGYPNDYYASKANKGMAKALETLDDSNASAAVVQLLTVPEKIVPGSMAMDLMVSLPDTDLVKTKKMESRLVELFVTISKSERTAKAIDDRLIELKAKRPTDLSLGILHAMFRMRIKHEKANDALQNLVSLVDEKPLETIPEGRRPNSRQRREATHFVPLWLVARECLLGKDSQSTGQKLADQAMSAARRQTGTQHSMAVLFDWAKLLLDQGDRKNAEAKLNELLKIATERPQRKANSEQAKVESAPLPLGVKLPPGVAERLNSGAPATAKRTTTDVTPPLTMSQFNLAIAIASLASENSMPELSRKAVQDSLVGGIPVTDITVVDPNATRQVFTSVGGFATTSTIRGGDTSGDLESRVASSLHGIVTKWKGDEYPAADVFELLKPMVLPSSRASEILMFADSSNLREAKISSLAQTLVTWAKKAKKLDELKTQVEERMKSPNSKIAGAVMKTLIAIAADQKDEAKSYLEDLAKQSSTGMSPVMLQLACHAALPGAAIPAIQEPAFVILRKALELQTQAVANNPNSVEQSVGRLAEKINRYLADQGDADSIRKYFDSLLVSRQSYYSRYSGDSPLYYQARDTALFAGEAARIGMPTVALDFIGRATDFKYERFAKPPVKLPLAVSVRDLKAKPAAERYAAWHAWSMPNENRQAVRFIAEWVPLVHAPEAFLKIQPMPGSPFDNDLLCNLTELVAAARESGNLEKLQAETEQASGKKLPYADLLKTLILIESRDFKACEPLIQLLVNDLSERKKPQTQLTTSTARREYQSDYVLYRTCMQAAESAVLYKKALGKPNAAVDEFSIPGFQSQIVFDLAKRASADAGASIQPGDDAGLQHWFQASSLSEPISAIKPWWIAQEGHVAHLAGSGTDLLYFKYPLQGDFEFSVDCSNADVGYGGCVFQPQRAELLSLSGRESVSLASGQPTGIRAFNRFQIQSKANKQTVLLNGHEIYSEANTATSPWLTILSNQNSGTAFRNPMFKGSPVIPREVPLLSEDSMDGWNCSFFNETRTRKRLMAVKAASQSEPNYYEQQQESANVDWNIKDGILVGDGKPELREPGQSWIYYHRPLLQEEAFRYEFFYKPGDSIAHPTIGRIAILLDPNGIQSHWISQPSWDEPTSGIPDDNAIIEAECRRGPSKLSLKENDWNAVDLTLKNNVAVVSLNGVVVYERPQDKQLDYRFGIFRYKNETCKVRQAILTGPWPQSLTPEISQNLIAVSTPRSAVDRRVIHSILTDRVFESDIQNVVAKARALSVDKAYELLKQWVLPSSDHANVRLYYQLAPFAQQALAGNEPERLSSESEGSLLCPAIELVKSAAELNRLPELLQEVRSIETTDSIEARNRNAIISLIAMQHGDNEAARLGMAELYKAVFAGLPVELERRDRAAEFVVAWQASQRPGLLNFASDLSVALTKMERSKEGNSKNNDWKVQLGILAGRIADTSRGIATQMKPNELPLTQWHAIPYLKPEHRSHGYQPSHWLYQRGMLQHVSGGTWRQLYFQSPLRGKFEIVADRSMFQNKDMALAYGMHSVELLKQTQSIGISKVMHNSREIDKKVDGPTVGDVFPFRIAVDGTKVTTYINGVLIHEETFDSPPDPWIVLQAKQPHFASLVRDLRILGTPQIPKEIDLIDMNGWAGWRADIFRESHSGDRDAPPKKRPNAPASTSSSTAQNNEPWQLTGDEIIGMHRKNRGDSPTESLLMYQRPMLEDGEIEWDSFFIPGEVEVHPAIGRGAFIIRSNGVRLHRLTEGVYETSGIAIDNESPIEGAAKEISLKEKDWNHFKLAMKGDRMTLTVNDKPVAQATILEVPTERYFGLFHYANATKSRVRNLVYRGEWPKTLPSVADQQLAYSKGGPCQLESANGFDIKDLVMKPSLEAIQKAGIVLQGRENQFAATDVGFKIAMRDAKIITDRPMLQLPIALDQDCEITVDYRDLTLKPAKQGYGVSFALAANLDDAELSIIECSAKVLNTGEKMSHGSIRRKSPVGAYTTPETIQTPEFFPSGRLRLVRKAGEIHCLNADAGSNDFRLIYSCAVGATKINSFTIEAKSSDDVGQVDVTLEKLTIRAPKK